VPTAFGRVLARPRDASGRTALPMAEALGLTEEELIEMERGQRQPSLTDLFMSREC